MQIKDNTLLLTLEAIEMGKVEDFEIELEDAQGSKRKYLQVVRFSQDHMDDNATPKNGGIAIGSSLRMVDPKNLTSKCPARILDISSLGVVSLAFLIPVLPLNFSE